MSAAASSFLYVALPSFLRQPETGRHVSAFNVYHRVTGLDRALDQKYPPVSARIAHEEASTVGCNISTDLTGETHCAEGNFNRWIVEVAVGGEGVRDP